VQGLGTLELVENDIPEAAHGHLASSLLQMTHLHRLCIAEPIAKVLQHVPGALMCLQGPLQKSTRLTHIRLKGWLDSDEHASALISSVFVLPNLSEIDVLDVKSPAGAAGIHGEHLKCTVSLREAHVTVSGAENAKELLTAMQERLQHDPTWCEALQATCRRLVMWA
jgi:hypothetical protein